ncbi:hypothetical protein RVW51_000159 [Citrobacter freundii]|uniref:hypothetical protein n=1 Tax=Citrobacter freundii complex TaxID=1344959 RepID=UPI000517C4D8|nr:MULTISPECIES: hypothetical protein [Citrobacter freundii complex]ELK6673114.1 hypothetical protein [Citrobacter freundii]WFV24828.1 hypothetical protein NFJ24_10440 [Citrobacter braakii]
MKQHKDDFYQPAELDEIQIIPASYDLHRVHNSSPSFHPLDITRTGYIFSKHNQTDEENDSDMSNKTISRTEFWLGTIGVIFTCLAAAVGATWTISNNINDKANDTRKELAANIQSSKSEISLRMDRLEDKLDSSSKDTSDKLMRIQLLLEAKSENK